MIVDDGESDWWRKDSHRRQLAATGSVPVIIVGVEHAGADILASDGAREEDDKIASRWSHNSRNCKFALA